MSAFDPSDEELASAEQFQQSLDTDPIWEDPLEDLLNEALLARKLPPKRKKSSDPAVRAINPTEAMRALYSNPENWTRTRGLALVDKQTHTVIGNYSEYIHNQVPSTRKLIREHQPIAVDGMEEIDGYLGPEKELSVRSITWDKTFPAVEGIVLDELGVEAPAVEVTICTRFNMTVKVTLDADTQFASASGNVLLQFPAGTDIFPACSTDTKISLRKWVME